MMKECIDKKITEQRFFIELQKGRIRMRNSVKYICIALGCTILIAAASLVALKLIGKEEDPGPANATPTPVITEALSVEPTATPTDEQTIETPSPTGEETPEPTMTPDESSDVEDTPAPSTTVTAKPTQTPKPSQFAPTPTYGLVTPPPPTPKPTPTPAPPDPSPGKAGHRAKLRNDLLKLIEDVKNNLNRGYFEVNRTDHWAPMHDTMNEFCDADARGEQVPDFEGYTWREDLSENQYRIYEIFDFAKVKFTVPDNWTDDQIFQKIKTDYKQHLYNQNTEKGSLSVYCNGDGTTTVVVYFYNGTLTTVTRTVVSG